MGIDMKNPKWEYIIPLLLIVLIFSFATFIWAVQSHFEAKAFNRLTGKNVSTWDAMWLQLRVDGCRE